MLRTFFFLKVKLVSPLIKPLSFPTVLRPRSSGPLHGCAVKCLEHSLIQSCLCIRNIHFPCLKTGICVICGQILCVLSRAAAPSTVDVSEPLARPSSLRAEGRGKVADGATPCLKQPSPAVCFSRQSPELCLGIGCPPCVGCSFFASISCTGSVF